MEEIDYGDLSFNRLNQLLLNKSSNDRALLKYLAQISEKRKLMQQKGIKNEVQN